MQWREIVPAEPPPEPDLIEQVGYYTVEVYAESSPAGQYVGKIRTPAWAAMGPLYSVAYGQTAQEALINAAAWLGFEPDEEV